MEFLHELLGFIDAGAKKSGFSEERRSRIRLASEEALVNVILHAYSGAEGQVEARFSETGEGALNVEIRDRGSFFDPLNVGKPDFAGDLAERKVGGLGIFFIREVTDRMGYRREGEENVLTLTFLKR